MTEFSLEPLDDDEDQEEKQRLAAQPTGKPTPWVFRADPSCALGRERDGETIEVPEGANPPVACEGTTCSCRFVATAERRKAVRRKGGDRRESLRFEKKGDRRKADRRRSADLWRGRGK